MPIFDDVSAQLKEAMRAKDKPRLSALRNIRAAFLEAVKADGREALPDEEAQQILFRLAKQRRESIEQYAKGGRTDLVASERAELEVIEAFLPKQADEATVRQWAEQAIAATGASSPRDMGKVMGRLMAEHKGELDGKLANQVVRDLLGG